MKKNEEFTKKLDQLNTTKEKNEEKQLDEILDKLHSNVHEENAEDEKQLSTDIQKAKSVRMQKKICDQFLHQRILLQKPMTFLTKFPQSEELIQKMDSSFKSKLTHSKRQTKQHIKNLQSIQKDLFKISETSIKLQEIDEEDSTHKIWKSLDSNFSKVIPFAEQTIEKWNSRNQQISMQKNKQFNKSVVEQVQTIVKDQHVFKQAVQKTQYKRDTYSVLGQSSAADLTNDRDQNIYNDHDFYTVLLSDFLAMNDEGAEEGADGGNGDFLHGADLSMT